MTMTGIVKVIHEWTGWCPDSCTRMAENGSMVLPLPSAGVSDAGDPPSGSNPSVRSRFEDWFTGIAIVILFATLGLGGFYWWPFFVLAVLAAGLIYWYFFVQKRGS